MGTYIGMYGLWEDILTHGKKYGMSMTKIGLEWSDHGGMEIDL